MNDSLSSDETGFHCPRCGSADFDALVRNGSYLLRCRSCRELAISTSWLPIGHQWHSHVYVYRDGEVKGAPILEGIGSELVGRIGALAKDGTTLLLREHPISD